MFRHQRPPGERVLRTKAEKLIDEIMHQLKRGLKLDSALTSWIYLGKISVTNSQGGLK